MTTSRVTKSQARSIAREARRYGYFDTGRTLWVKCPQCGERVEEDRQPASRMTIVKQLDSMMVFHLDGFCEAK